MISKRWRKSCLLTKTLPGAECVSDHQLLIAKLRLKLKKTQYHSTTIHYDIEEIPHIYAVMTGNCFNDLLNIDEETTPDELWMKTKEVIHKCAKRTLRQRPVKKKSEYLSSETLQLIDE